MASLMIVPEFIIHRTLERALQYVRDDYASQADKTKSYLYMLLSGSGYQRYDYFKQAAKIVCGSETDPRFLEVDVMFNVSRDHVPTVHITMPADQTQGQGNSLGIGEEEDEQVYIDHISARSEARPIFARRFVSTYNIIITSDNVNEVVLLYHLLRSLLIASLFQLNQEGLQNVMFGGQDIRPYENVAPNLFMRTISMNLQYETRAISLNPRLVFNDISSDGKPSND